MGQQLFIPDVDKMLCTMWKVRNKEGAQSMRHTRQSKTSSRSTLGPLIRKYRMARNIEQKIMARALSLSTAQMSKLEAGLHEPKESTSLKILSILFPRLQSEILRVEAELEATTKGAP